MEDKKKARKEMIKYRMKQAQDFIKYNRNLINELKRELDFINGNIYDKSWEEEYLK